MTSCGTDNCIAPALAIVPTQLALKYCPATSRKLQSQILPATTKIKVYFMGFETFRDGIFHRDRRRHIFFPRSIF